jgi:hypothetical protein
MIVAGVPEGGSAMRDDVRCDIEDADDDNDGGGGDADYYEYSGDDRDVDEGEA